MKAKSRLHSRYQRKNGLYIYVGLSREKVLKLCFSRPEGTCFVLLPSTAVGVCPLSLQAVLRII